MNAAWRSDTAALEHTPVLLTEVIAALGPKAEGVYVDGTFGAGFASTDTITATVWAGGAENELATPDTWEVALSAAGRAEGAEKRAVWERLLALPAS